MKPFHWATLFLLSASLLHAADPETLAPATARLLKDAGAVSYARKAPYGAGISEVTLGFDAAGKIVAGVAMRDTKTYKETTAIVSVVPVDGQYKISAAEIPDLSSFHGKSQTLAADALKAIAGQMFADEGSTKTLMDGVTGATPYLKAIYVSYSHMAGKVIGEIKAAPAWERKPLAAP